MFITERLAEPFCENLSGGPDNKKRSAELNGGKMVSLMEMDDTQKVQFSNLVSLSNGVVRVLIHPFYMFRTIPERFNDNTRLTQYYDGIMRVFKKRTPNSLPLIVFEDTKKVESTSEFFSRYSEPSNKPVYLIETYHGSPDPISQQVYGKKEPSCCWSPVIGKMEAAGIRKIILGGSYLNFSTADMNSRTKNDPYYRPFTNQLYLKGAALSNIHLINCVGKAAYTLANNFEITLSSLIYPENLVSLYQKLGIMPNRMDASL